MIEVGLSTIVTLSMLAGAGLTLVAVALLRYLD